MEPKTQRYNSYFYYDYYHYDSIYVTNWIQNQYKIELSI